MSKIIRFRRPMVHRRFARRPGGMRRRRRGGFEALRTVTMLVVLLCLYALSEPALVPTGGVFVAERERVAERFTLCGPGRGHACVIDGDTIKLGKRKVRLIGLDAPELIHPRCEREARLAKSAQEQLLRLLNGGAFVMLADRRDSVDRYRRDLRRLVRPRQDGSEEDIAELMIAQGLAARYVGMKADWC
ncbi:thermonuclease family protein [Sphingomicrobium sp. XHP0235]|uniref:thermonuclease family protein n=1 Tax=Sphingomicrobium aquimarinum TaxID=3133971 RepID=UPI0031FE6504